MNELANARGEKPIAILDVFPWNLYEAEFLCEGCNEVKCGTFTIQWMSGDGIGSARACGECQRLLFNNKLDEMERNYTILTVTDPDSAASMGEATKEAFKREKAMHKRRN